MNPRAIVIGTQEDSLGELVSLLEEAGIEAVAMNGSDWQPEELDRIEPQAIVVEGGTDATDGWDVSLSVRRCCDIPIILLGTTESEMAWVKAAAYGVDCYLKRPFSPMELVARVRAIIRRYERREANPDLPAPTTAS